MGRQGAVVIDAPDNVGVADINDEEHGTYSTFRSGSLASRLLKKTVRVVREAIPESVDLSI